MNVDCVSHNRICSSCSFPACIMCFVCFSLGLFDITLLCCCEHCVLRTLFVFSGNIYLFIYLFLVTPFFDNCEVTLLICAFTLNVVLSLCLSLSDWSDDSAEGVSAPSPTPIPKIAIQEEKDDNSQKEWGKALRGCARILSAFETS